MSPQPDQELRYGVLPRTLWKDAIRILSEEQVSIAGLSHECVWRAFLRDSVRSRHPLIVAAYDSRGVRGVVLSVIHPARYWPLMAMRHPVVALRIMGARFRRKLGATGRTAMDALEDRNVLELMVPNRSGRRWSDSSPQIAKIIFIGVDRRHRRQSIGRGLYEQLFRQLRSRGVRRVDACINWPNMPSIRLHHASGWRLLARSESVMATFDLGDGN